MNSDTNIYLNSTPEKYNVLMYGNFFIFLFKNIKMY